MFFKKKWESCKVYCQERHTKYYAVDERNEFEYEFLFYIVEPELLEGTPWTEYSERPNKYRPECYYKAKRNINTGEVVINEEDRI